jgi:hypothetical protein
MKQYRQGGVTVNGIPVAALSMTPTFRAPENGFRLRRTREMILVALLAVTGCASARPNGPQREELLTAAPHGGACVPESTPAELPAVDLAVDSAMLHSSLEALLAAAPAPTGYVLLSLAWDERGLSVRRDILEYSTTRAVADSVRLLVFAARRYMEESEREWGVRLRVELNGHPGYTVGRREYCPPDPRSPAMRDAMQSYVPAGDRARRGGGRLRTVHMRAFVTELGTISTGGVLRGELPGSTLERNIVQYLRSFLFAPATVDGQATGAWVEIPVRVRIP